MHARLIPALFLLLTAGASPAPRAPRPAPKATLGSFSQPQTLSGTINGQAYTWKGNLYFGSQNGSNRTVYGTGAFTLGTPPPPPPVTLAIAGLTVNPGTVTAGQGAIGTVTLNRAPDQAVQITLKALDAGLTVPAAVTINVNQTAGTFAIGTPASQTGDFWYSLSCAYNGQSRLASLLVKANVTPPVTLPVVSGLTAGDGTAIPAVGLVVGATFVINGNNFGTETSGNQIAHVQWNGLECGKLAWAATQITAKLPPALSASGLVTVITTGGQTAIGPMLTVMGLPQGPKPAIRKVSREDGSPASGLLPLDTVVAIDGENFGPAGRLFVNGYLVPAASWTDLRVTYRVSATPSNALPTTVTVLREDGATYSGLFEPGLPTRIRR